MAKVFVEDCLDRIENRFMLVVLAAHRARQIGSGKASRIPINGSNLGVIALREIATRNVRPKELKISLIESLQTRIEVDLPEAALPAASTAADHQRTTNVGEDIRFDSWNEEALLAGINSIVEPDREEDDPERQKPSADRSDPRLDV